MKEIVLDLETDGLLDTVTKVHCLVYKADDLITVATTEEQILKALDVLLTGQIIGHNVLGFDLEVLKRLYGFEVPVEQVTDTLILSRLIHADLRTEDSKVQRLEPKYFGSHSLKAWGYRLDNNKGDYGSTENAFEELSQEMIDYCIQDVELTDILWKNFSWRLPDPNSVWLEHQIANICNTQEKHGIKFDEAKAVQLYTHLASKRDVLEVELKDIFGSWIINEGLRRKALYSKIKIIEFNPNSRQHIAKRLKELRGWKPKEFTATGEAKVDESILSKLKYPEAESMTEYLMLNKRISQLAEGEQAWLKLVKNGRLHGRVNTKGASTSRCSHSSPNLAQVPNSNAPFGQECRTLFTADRRHKLLGVDISGLELRCLSHYLALYDHGEYGKKLLEEDIHTVNQEAAGLATRDQAKTFIYGFLYGAGDQKIGEIVGKGSTEGKKLKKKFLSQLPALKQLRKDVQKKAEQGFLKGLDGRCVPVRSKHAALNTLLQSAGAIICKRWVVETHRLLTENGFKCGHDFSQVAFVHDEIQLTVKEEYAEEIGKICTSAIIVTGVRYGLRLPLTGEYKVGSNWSETH